MQSSKTFTNSPDAAPQILAVESNSSDSQTPKRPNEGIGFADKSKRIPKFMNGKVPNVAYVENAETRERLKEKVRTMLQPFASEPLKDQFPGCQAVSMQKQNITKLSSHPYMVSWKADGMRYLVLINGEDEVYAFDRDNNVFRLPLKFPRKDHLDQHVCDTLVDGEVVIEAVETNGGIYNRANLLIFDIIIHQGKEIGKENFKKRHEAINTFLTLPRSIAVKRKLLDKRREPLSIRRMDFFEITETKRLLSAEFRNSIGHKIDGLVFHPNEPYLPGRFDKLIKWKSAKDLTVDFLLKIAKVENPGQGNGFVGELYVLGRPKPFRKIYASDFLKKFDGRIIECTYKVR